MKAAPRYDRYTQESIEVVAIDSITNAFTYFTVRGDLLHYNQPLDARQPNRDSILFRDTVRQLRRPRFPEAFTHFQPGESYVEDTLQSDTIYRTFMLEDGPCGLLTAKASTDVLVEPGERCGLDAGQLDADFGFPFTPHVPVYLDTVPGIAGTTVRATYLVTPDTVCGEPFDFSDVIIGVYDFDPAFEGELRVYPNPTHGILHVELPGTRVYEIRLYNQAGTQVQSQFIRGGTLAEIPVNTHPTGTYVLIVYDQVRAVGRRRVVVVR